MCGLESNLSLSGYRSETSCNRDPFSYSLTEYLAVDLHRNSVAAYGNKSLRAVHVHVMFTRPHIKRPATARAQALEPSPPPRRVRSAHP
eukprot:COSAG05_NODE_5396_length_1188_cov_1.144169_3_plen_88_part_01